MSALMALGNPEGDGVVTPLVCVGFALLMAIVAVVEALVFRRLLRPRRVWLHTLTANLAFGVIAFVLTVLVGSNLFRLLAVWACAYLAGTTYLGWRWRSIGWHRVLPTLAVANAVGAVILLAAAYPLWDTVLRTNWTTTPATALLKAIPKSEHWTPIWADQCFEIADVDVVDSNHIWVARHESPLLHSPDGGSTWIARKGPCDEIRFLNRRVGWAVDAGYIDVKPSRIGRTLDGGDSWTWVSLRYDNLYDIAPVSAKEAWALSWASNKDHSCSGPDSLAHTVDGGASWATVLPPRPVRLSGLFFLDRDHGWAIGDQQDASAGPLTVLRTGDAGRSFQAVTIPFGRTGLNERWHIEFRDPLEGWAAVGGESLLHTIDGGKAWTLVTPAPYPGVSLTNCSFPTRKDGWAVGLVREGPHPFFFPLAFHTKDGGKTWRPVSTAGGMCGSIGKVVSPTATCGVLAGGVFVPGASAPSTNFVLLYKP